VREPFVSGVDRYDAQLSTRQVDIGGARAKQQRSLHYAHVEAYVDADGQYNSQPSAIAK